MRSVLAGAGILTSFNERRAARSDSHTRYAAQSPLRTAITASRTREFNRGEIMGNRLSKIYTRTGDDGTTGTGDGSRIAKDHPRMQAIGSVDEVNSLIGMLIAELPA